MTSAGGLGHVARPPWGPGSLRGPVEGLGERDGDNGGDPDAGRHPGVVLSPVPMQGRRRARSRAAPVPRRAGPERREGAGSGAVRCCAALCGAAALRCPCSTDAMERSGSAVLCSAKGRAAPLQRQCNANAMPVQCQCGGSVL